MPFQLTYALRGTDEVYMVQLEVDEEDMVFTYEVALAYIAEQHGDGAIEAIQGISLLRP